MRTEFVPHIQDFVTEHDLFKNEAEVGIEFAHKGISSVIAIIDTPAGKWVLKIPRNKTHTVGEGQFFQVWEKAGVTVPHVIDVGELNGSPYTLMEFIDASTLDTCYSHEELLARGIFTEMGKALRLMHSEPADGYGFVVDGKPEFETVEEWLEADYLKKRFFYFNKHKILEGIEDELDKALEVIKQHAKNSDSTYCHDDFGTANIFATDPITIFDPQPRFNSGYYAVNGVRSLSLACQQLLGLR
jgi:fructosamine-3-kinase